MSGVLAGVAGSFGISYNYIGSYINATAASSYTFTTATIEPGLAVVIFHSEASGTTASNPPTTVTIGGISATRRVNAASTGTGASNTTIWSAVISSSTTSVQVTLPTSIPRGSIGVYLIKDYASSTPFFTGSSQSAGNAPVTRTVTTSVLQPRAVIIAAQTSSDRYVHTWSGVTENYDTLFGTGTVTGPTGASLLTPVGGAVTITTTIASGAGQASSLAVAVWI